MLIAQCRLASTVECAGTGTVIALHKVRTCDLDVKNQTQCGKNAQYVCHQCHFRHKLYQVGKRKLCQPGQEFSCKCYHWINAGIVFHHCIGTAAW